MRDCPAPGCTVQVPRERFLCRPHWFALPKPLRDDVWRAYRAWRDRRTVASARALRDAHKAAVDALAVA